MDEDLWATDTGIKTDYEGVVVDAFFLPQQENNFGEPQLQLHLKMATTDDDVVDERWNCGPDWSSPDGGETAQHPTKKLFNRNSQAGILVDAVVKIGAGDTLRERGAPTTAKNWLGCRFFMEATTRSGKRRDTGEEWTSTKNYPTKFLGVEDVESSGETGSGLGTVGSPLERLSADSVAKITLLAKTLPFGEWVDKVMEVEGVMQNDDLVMLLTDENGLYRTLKEK